MHNNHSHKVVFNDICEVLGEILESNILVISKKGKVLGVAICPGIDEIEELIADQVGGYIDGMLNERLLSVLSTKENVNLATLGFAEENVRKYQAIILQSTFPESVLERFSSTKQMRIMTLMTLF